MVVLWGGVLGGEDDGGGAASSAAGSVCGAPQSPQSLRGIPSVLSQLLVTWMSVASVVPSTLRSCQSIHLLLYDQILLLSFLFTLHLLLFLARYLSPPPLSLSLSFSLPLSFSRHVVLLSAVYFLCDFHTVWRGLRFCVAASGR